MDATRDLAGMIALGFFGGAHCLGMCGPISIGVGARTAPGMLLYNAGRIVTYSAIGAVMGSIGPVAGTVVGLARVQLMLSVIAGLLLGWFGLSMLRVTSQPGWMRSSAVLPGTSALLRYAAGPSRRGWWTGLPLGLLLGFLPCGLSMAAFVRALDAGSPQRGAMLVAAFGVGTLPSMLLAGWLGAKLSIQWRKIAELAAGVLLTALAMQQLARVIAALGN